MQINSRHDFIALSRYEFATLSNGLTTFVVPILFCLLLALPMGLSFYVKALLLGILATVAMLRIAFLGISKELIILIFLFGFFIALKLIFSEYGSSETIQSTVFLLSTIIVLKKETFSPIGVREVRERNKLKSFLVSTSFASVLIYSLAICVSSDNAFIFPGLGDQNYSAFVCCFLYALFFQKKYWPLCLVCIVCTLLTTSRAGFVAIVLETCIAVYTQFFCKHRQMDFNPFNRKSLRKYIMVFASIFVALFVGILLFSYFWAYFVVGSNTGDYHSGLNDASNAIRFSSNVYSFVSVLSDFRAFLFGTDSGILDFLGINSASPENGTIFNGFRVVQPHNIYLNTLLVQGLFLSTLTFFSLAKLFAENLSSKTLPMIACVLFFSLFIHSITSNYYCPFIFILMYESAGTRKLGSVKRSSVLIK